jgi:hypothetical protein
MRRTKALLGGGTTPMDDAVSSTGDYLTWIPALLQTISFTEASLTLSFVCHLIGVTARLTEIPKIRFLI